MLPLAELHILFYAPSILSVSSSPPIIGYDERVRERERGKRKRYYNEVIRDPYDTDAQCLYKRWFFSTVWYFTRHQWILFHNKIASITFTITTHCARGCAEMDGVIMGWAKRRWWQRQGGRRRRNERWQSFVLSTQHLSFVEGNNCNYVLHQGWDNL